MSNLGVAGSIPVTVSGSLVPTLIFFIPHRIGQKERFQERSFLKRFFLCHRKLNETFDLGTARRAAADSTVALFFVLSFTTMRRIESSAADQRCRGRYTCALPHARLSSIPPFAPGVRAAGGRCCVVAKRERLLL